VSTAAHEQYEAAALRAQQQLAALRVDTERALKTLHLKDQTQVRTVVMTITDNIIWVS
jgi:hypothetical protein